MDDFSPQAHWIEADGVERESWQVFRKEFVLSGLISSAMLLIERVELQIRVCPEIELVHCSWILFGRQGPANQFAHINPPCIFDLVRKSDWISIHPTSHVGKLTRTD